jgi:hypothetical protein
MEIARLEGLTFFYDGRREEDQAGFAQDDFVYRVRIIRL